MDNILLALRGIALAAALASCVGSGANEPAGSAGVQHAIAELSASRGWQHLDANWIDAVTAVTASGPEINADVSVMLADGQPVVGAIVALQESIGEAHSHVSLFAEPFQPVRAVAATDANGSCRFDAVPMTPPGMGKHGRIRAYVVIAHPKHGFDYFPLLRTSREQTVKVTMRDQVSMPVVVRNASQATEVRITRFDLRRSTLSSSRGFDADAMFSPRAVVNPQADGEFTSLPTGQFVGFEVHDQEGWKIARMKTLLPTDSRPALIDVNGPTPQLPMRFIDSVTKRPVSGVSVDRWRRPRQISKDDGRVMIEPAFPERVFRMGRVDKLRFVVEPPPNWVRESVWEYPHEIGSGPVSFRLTPGVIVRGRVVDAKSGEGISGVVIQSQRPNVRPGGVTSQYQAIAVSDDTGSFELSVPMGRQTVSVAAPVEGFLLPTEKRLSVTAGGPVKPITIKMLPAEPIRGRIVDENGHAVSGVEVICHSAKRTIRYRDGYPLDSTIASSRTNHDGEFAIDRPSGNYGSLMIKAFADGGRQSRDALIEFDPESNRRMEVDLELSLGERSRAVELVGSVLKDGKPWAGAVVTIDPPPTRTLEGRVSAGGGKWRGTSQLGETTTDQQGAYRVTVNVSDHAAVILGVRTSTRRHVVTLNGSRIEVPPMDVREKIGDKTIKGVVVDPLGLPVPGVVVAASDQRTIRVDRARPKQNPHRVTTNPNGGFVLRELFDGPVSVRVSPRNIPAQYSVSSTVSFPAGSSDARIVFDQSLSRVPDLVEPVTETALFVPSKRVVFRSDGSGLDSRTRVRGVVADQKGKPVDQAIVRVFCVTPRDSTAEFNPLSHPACRLATKTNSQGRFAIGPFPAGAKVRIAAGANGLSAQVTDFLSLGDKGATAEIELKRYDPDLPELKTTHQLVDSQGNPVPGAIVSAQYKSYADVLEFESDTDPCVMTDGQGNFRFPTAIGVDYKTVAAFPIGNVACVISNAYSHREYRLADSMSIRGRVIDQNDQPVAGLVVSISNDRTPGIINVATSQDGTFRIDDLPFGKNCSFFGFSQSAPWHHLQLRRIDCVARKGLDFGDLITAPTSRLAVKVIPAPGKQLPPTLAVRIGSARVDVTPDGNAFFHSVGPRSFMELVGPAAVSRTEPPLQRTWGERFGINTTETKVVVVHLK